MPGPDTGLMNQLVRYRACYREMLGALRCAKEIIDGDAKAISDVRYEELSQLLANTIASAEQLSRDGDALPG